MGQLKICTQDICSKVGILEGRRGKMQESPEYALKVSLAGVWAGGAGGEGASAKGVEPM